MKQTHRKVNNVGYKPVYPMSPEEDSSMCQYCGRHGGSGIQITDDHVPPLNVKIPEEFLSEVKKTLIRACSECNSLAGDVPHMTYQDRHLWLKARYIERYVNLLVSFDPSVRKSHNTIVNNQPINEREEIRSKLAMIGFGLLGAYQIESPLLERKTKSGKKIGDLIDENVYGVPYHDYDDEPDDQSYLNVAMDEIEAEDDGKERLDYESFLDFLAAENIAGVIIFDLESYSEWLVDHPSRASSLELPVNPEKYYSRTWSDITRLVAVKVEACKQAQESEGYESNDETEAESEECIRTIREESNHGSCLDSYFRKESLSKERQFNRLIHRPEKIKRELRDSGPLGEVISSLMRKRRGNIFQNPMTESELLFVLEAIDWVTDESTFGEWRQSLEDHHRNFVPHNPEVRFGQDFWAKLST